MGKGKTFFRSVKLETPEIVSDIQRVAYALPCYEDGVGNVTRVVMHDGAQETRLYKASYWMHRFTKFHGVSETLHSEIEERLARNRSIPVPVEDTVLIPIKVRTFERVAGDGTMGYVLLDQIQEVVSPTYLNQLDPTFFKTNPDAKCALLLKSGRLLACVQPYAKVTAQHRDAIIVDHFMRAKQKEAAHRRSKTKTYIDQLETVGDSKQQLSRDKLHTQSQSKIYLKAQSSYILTNENCAEPFEVYDPDMTFPK